MKIERQFNTFTFEEYFYHIKNHKKFIDFNTLGLYRSLNENDILSVAEKIEVRDFAHAYFKKQFDFLQIKDPSTYIAVNVLGDELTEADIHQLWVDVWDNQKKILKTKRIKHRNFGVYSKHSCPYHDCPYNGMMVNEGEPMKFDTMPDRRTNYEGKVKSDKIKSERKTAQLIINSELNL